jgi:hypothetical protein
MCAGFGKTIFAQALYAKRLDPAGSKNLGFAGAELA